MARAVLSFRRSPMNQPSTWRRVLDGLRARSTAARQRSTDLIERMRQLQRRSTEIQRRAREQIHRRTTGQSKDRQDE